MATPDVPRPDEPDGLSGRERKILAAIEKEMFTTDHTLARDLTGAQRLRHRSRVWAALRHGVLLVVALIILIVAAVMMPTSWWHVLGLLTALLLIPWILLFPTDHPNRS